MGGKKRKASKFHQEHRQEAERFSTTVLHPEVDVKFQTILLSMLISLWSSDTCDRREDKSGRRARSHVRSHTRSHIRSHTRSHIRSYARSYTRSYVRRYIRSHTRSHTRSHIRSYVRRSKHKIGRYIKREDKIGRHKS